MALPGSSAFFKAPTALEQLLEEINFQRTKEMRQLMKDDSGFVVLQGTSYWTDLFVRHFLFQTEHCIDCDDLLFFVRKKHIKSSSRYLPKFETEVNVFRKASRKLPIGDPDMDWEETVYLNLIIHQFDYTLTLAICTRTSPKELQVLKRHSQKVYASPSRRRMDTKAEAEEMTYPNICFMVDNFNEVFCDILVRDGEMVCVELVASDRDGAVQSVIFLGSIRYDALKRVYDARSSLSSKMAQRMTFGLFSNSSSQRVEFVRMKGPQGKGHAEMAVTKPKGYGAETPTSEPGYCATDMWDSDWDSDPEDFFVYRHQRRLSDPSANINNFVRGGWKTKPTDTAGSKARSENEGLDSLANGLNEIEAGDLRDDCEFCKHSASAVCKPSVSNHVVPPQSASSVIASFFPVNKTRAPPSLAASLSEAPYPGFQAASATTPQSYSVNVGEPSASIPPPLSQKSSCSEPSPPRELTDVDTGAPSKETHHDIGEQDDDDDDDFEDCVSSLSEATPIAKSNSVSSQDSPVRQEIWKDASDICAHNKVDSCEECALEKSVSEKAFIGSTVNGSREWETADMMSSTYQNAQTVNFVEEKSNEENVELPERVVKTDLSQSLLYRRSKSVDIGGTWPRIKESAASTACLIKKEVCKHGVEGKCILCGDRRPFFGKLRERHKEQVELIEKEKEKRNYLASGRFERGSKPQPQPQPKTKPLCCHCDNERNSHQFHSIPSLPPVPEPVPVPEPEPELAAEAELDAELEPLSPKPSVSRTPSRRRKTDSSSRREAPQPPHRVMPDGTSIYYWCDVADRPPDQAEHELDDGAYNPLWTMRGFTQTFHFWKENKRAQSVPLNAFLTYITLPWWSIAKDILDHREKPTLTF